MTTVATWNVNSIKARLPNVLDWLLVASPDVVLLQEVKCEAHAFPRLEFEAVGYRCAVVGQKAYNGVAILSKGAIENVCEGLPGDDADGQARYLEADTLGLRVCCLYLPNGNPVASEKYPYKLAWMDRLRRRAQQLLAMDAPFLLGGDFNVIPEPIDCRDPAAWAHDALFLLDTRRAFRAIEHLGLVDAFRALHPTEIAYSFWDYQGRAWPSNNGIRIDHFLLSPRLADRLEACTIDREPRGKDRASDHTPVVVTIGA